MYEIYNNLAKVQDTRKNHKGAAKKKNTDATCLWTRINPDRENLVHVFGGAFRVKEQKAA